MSKNINVPKLRFKEFSGEWGEKKLGEIADISSGGTPLRNKLSYWNGTIPWVTTSLIDFKDINSAEEYITEEGLNNSSAKLFEKNTILMAMYGQGKTRGKVGILKISATTNQACASINSKGIDYKFLYQYLINQYDNIRNLSNEGGQKNLSGSIIKNIIIIYPSKQEQEKIASFLTSVDTKIEQLTKKDELLQQYKKGVMQKIFNQEIRFKADDEREFPEWEEKKLKDITIKKSSNISANTLEENIGQYKIYGATGYLKNVDFYTEDKPYISIVKDGAGVGRVLMCDSQSSVLGTLDIIQNNQKVNLYFVYLLLSRIHFEKYIAGSTIPHIYYKDYSREKVGVPCLDEQTKIANFLSSIDDKIEENQKILEKTKDFKKVLLQQMFV